MQADSSASSSDPKPYDGREVVVVGGTGGIGGAIAEHFGRLGARVTVAGYPPGNPAGLDQRRRGGRGRCVPFGGAGLASRAAGAARRPREQRGDDPAAGGVPGRGLHPGPRRQPHRDDAGVRGGASAPCRERGLHRQRGLDVELLRWPAGTRLHREQGRGRRPHEVARGGLRRGRDPGQRGRAGWIRTDLTARSARTPTPNAGSSTARRCVGGEPPTTSPES